MYPLEAYNALFDHFRNYQAFPNQWTPRTLEQIRTDYSYEKVQETTKELVEELRHLFKNPIVVQSYSAADKFHVGIIPRSFQNKDINYGRTEVLNIVNKYLSRLVLNHEGLAFTNDVHIQKIPLAVRDKDTGLHITVGMNDQYLEKQGKKSFNKQALLDLNPEVGSRVLDLEVQQKVFDLEKFGFLFGNKATVEEVDGRTYLVGIPSQEAKKCVVDTRKLIFTAPNQKVAHMSLAMLTGKDKDGAWKHDLFDQTYCNQNPGFNPPTPLLLPGMYRGSTEYLAQMDGILKTFKYLG